uniref:Uncharacterized protein n=1 Tax=Sphaerodactylus townsendi TaxID=933632 RepID=A0ACB8EJC6_9SAUR
MCKDLNEVLSSSSLPDYFAQHTVLVLAQEVKWHALSREEQAKYYELARKERQLHMQLYPGWSARDNYVSALKSLMTEFGSHF